LAQEARSIILGPAELGRGHPANWTRLTDIATWYWYARADLGVCVNTTLELSGSRILGFAQANAAPKRSGLPLFRTGISHGRQAQALTIAHTPFAIGKRTLKPLVRCDGCGAMTVLSHARASRILAPLRMMAEPIGLRSTKQTPIDEKYIIPCTSPPGATAHYATLDNTALFRGDIRTRAPPTDPACCVARKIASYPSEGSDQGRTRFATLMVNDHAIPIP
jgi:hypothetical protein